MQRCDDFFVKLEGNYINIRKTMQTLTTILVSLVALEHLYILYMEMFAWETLGKKTFKGSLPDELFKPTKKLAANQGLYNGFLSAGLIWSFLIENPEWKTMFRFSFWVV